MGSLLDCALLREESEFQVMLIGASILKKQRKIPGKEKKGVQKQISKNNECSWVQNMYLMIILTPEGEEREKKWRNVLKL